MKTTRKFTLAFCTLITCVSVALALPASASLAPRYAAAAPSGVNGEYALGTVHTVVVGGGVHWCLTYPQHSHNGTPLYVYPCVKKDPYQQWYMWRIVFAGRIDLVLFPDVSVGQLGKATDNTVRLVDVLESPAAPHIVGFFPVKNSPAYAIELIGYGKKVMTVPGRLKSGFYKATWSKVTTVKGFLVKNQEWLLPTWQVLKDSQVPEGMTLQHYLSEVLPLTLER